MENNKKNFWKGALAGALAMFMVGAAALGIMNVAGVDLGTSQEKVVNAQEEKKLNKLKKLIDENYLYTDDLKEEDTTDEKLQTAIGKEYRKEFIGEGQWFFFCKRTDQATLPNVQVPFSKAYYVLPIPDQELEYGNRN